VTDITTPRLRAIQPLRDLQRINAAFSGLTGLAMATFNGWMSRQIDLPRPVIVVLGIGLISWSMMLVVLAVQPARRLARASTLVAAGDAAWVIGSAVLIALRDPTTAGTTFATAAAAVVAVFATAGFVLGGRARHHSLDDRTELLFRRVTVAARPSAAWQMVLDADLYARLAPNLTEISVAPDQCGRTCTDTRGNTWTEKMRLDHDRHVQFIDVDVTEHPMPLDHLAATVSVHDDPVGSRIDVAFTYVARATIKGLVASLVLPVLGRRLLRPIANGWILHATTPASTSRAAR
jgi:hypothetical protein